VIIVNHVFNDGNKRTGFVASALFLSENGYELIVKKEEIIHISRMLLIIVRVE